jgi:phage-related protein
MDDEKQIRWIGSSYDDLLAFPRDARKEAGFQLGKVQAGLDPIDCKPFDEVGAAPSGRFASATRAASTV